MPKPVTVKVDVPQARPDVFEFLDIMANHETFTDHMLVDWSYSGPDRGLGSRARVHSKAGRNEVVDFEVIEVEAPSKIVERNVSAKGKRIAYGTYELDELPAGGTRVAFTYAWERAPFLDSALGPVVGTVLRRGNRKAMERLAERLAE